MYLGLGTYSLGTYSLAQPILELATHPLCWLEAEIPKTLIGGGDLCYEHVGPQSSAEAFRS